MFNLSTFTKEIQGIRKSIMKRHNMKLIRYRVFIKYCVFSSNFCDFSELCQFRCSAGVLPAWCVYTHWHQGKTEKGKSPEYSKIFGKNTIFNDHPLPSSVLAKSPTGIGQIGIDEIVYEGNELAIWPKSVGDFANTGKGTFSKIWAGLRSKSGIIKTWGVLELCLDMG